MFVCMRLGLMMVMARRMHVLMLFGFFFIDFRRAQAALRGQMADIVDDVPHLLVFQNAFPSRHAGRTDAVFDNPL